MRWRLPMPVWIIQWAGQDVESWPLIGDAPIFTEHGEAQFGWMLETTLDRQEFSKPLSGKLGDGACARVGGEVSPYRSFVRLVHRFRETNRVPRIHFYRHGL